jgi:signal transduction histidine kinase
LINGVLNYTRVEAGVVSYDIKTVSVADAIASCEALVAPQINNKKLKFEWSVTDPQLGVCADREKLQQILLNLLTNAIKFTDPGGHISVSSNAENSSVHFNVSDTGRGIAEDHISHVFEPFVQVDSTFTRSQEGVGLGLAISRDLARGMGGDLTLVSKIDEGSTFTLTLPRGGD